MRSAIGSILLILAAAAAAQSQPATRPYVSIFGNSFATSLATADTVPLSNSYYFPHLAVGGGFQSTLTFLNYSPQNVTCQTTFYGDTGDLLPLPFATGTASSRTDNLGPGQSIHAQTTSDLNSPVSPGGWALAQCSGPIKASLLYSYYLQGKVVGEANVNAATAPATEFVTFANQQTGIAYANPSAQTATITITALDLATGLALATTTVLLPPNAHGAKNVQDADFLGLTNFTGMVEITSPVVPIVSVSVDAEDFPVISSMPPGDLPTGTPLATGH